MVSTQVKIICLSSVHIRNGAFQFATEAIYVIFFESMTIPQHGAEVPYGYFPFLHIEY